MPPTLTSLPDASPQSLVGIRLARVNASVQVLGTTPPRQGLSRPGESWYRTAERIAGDRGIPMAFDLTGEVKRFLIEPTLRVGLRPMTPYDLHDLARWIRAPHVAKWWSSEGPSDDRAIRERYEPGVRSESATSYWVVEANGRSIGWLQDYRVRDYPEYAQLAPDVSAVGFDYAIGEPAFVGRGWGPLMIWAWALAAHRRYPDVTTFFAAPDHRNGASLRALAKVGFVPGVWFDEPNPDGSVSTVVGCSLAVSTVLG